MYFIPLAWRLPFDVETFRQIKDKELNSCVDGNIFPSLIQILYDFVLLSNITWKDLILAKFVIPLQSGDLSLCQIPPV
jgi:hypothetical protein